MFVHGFHKQTPANVIAIIKATPSLLSMNFYVKQFAFFFFRKG